MGWILGKERGVGGIWLQRRKGGNRGIGDGNIWVRSGGGGGEGEGEEGEIEKNGVVRYTVKKEKEGVSGKWKTISRKEMIS